MATLNIKNMPDALYAKLRELARSERRSISQQVIHILMERIDRPSSVSILDLKGLGREEWREANGARHVHEERESWD